MGSATPILDTVHIFIVLEFGLIPHWQKLMEKSPTDRNQNRIKAMPNRVVSISLIYLTSLAKYLHQQHTWLCSPVAQ